MSNYFLVEMKPRDFLRLHECMEENVLVKIRVCEGSGNYYEKRNNLPAVEITATQPPGLPDRYRGVIYTVPTHNEIFDTKSVYTYLSSRLQDSPMEYEVSEVSEKGYAFIRYYVTVRRRANRKPGETPYVMADEGTKVLLASDVVYVAWPSRASMHKELSGIMRRALRKLRKLTGPKPKKPIVSLLEEDANHG